MTPFSITNGALKADAIARISTVTRDPESLLYLGRFLRPSGETSEAFFARTLGAV